MHGAPEAAWIVSVVRSHLETLLTRRGFAFHGGGPTAGGATTAVLYEASPDAVAENLPRLVPVGDLEGWRSATCVDFWVQYDHTEGSLDVHLDWWSLERLGEFVLDAALVESAVGALASDRPLDARLAAIGALVDAAFAEAADPTKA